MIHGHLAAHETILLCAVRPSKWVSLSSLLALIDDSPACLLIPWTMLHALRKAFTVCSIHVSQLFALCHIDSVCRSGALCRRTQVLILTVEPGFGGQKCQTAALDKVRQLRDRYPALQLTVDGGMSADTIGLVLHSCSLLVLSEAV